MKYKIVYLSFNGDTGIVITLKVFSRDTGLYQADKSPFEKDK